MTSLANECNNCHGAVTFGQLATFCNLGYESYQMSKVVLIRLGIHLFVNKAGGKGAPKFLFILCDVTSIWDWNYVAMNLIYGVH